MSQENQQIFALTTEYYQYEVEVLSGMASGMYGSKDFQKAMGIEDDSPYLDSVEDVCVGCSLEPHL